MAYTPDNNPYIPGDPYSYDLKWMVHDIKHMEARFEELDNQVQEATDQADRSEAEADRAEREADRSKDEADAAALSAENAEDSADNAADSEAAAKNYADHIADPVSGLVTSWLEENISDPTTPVIDKTLKIPSAAADAQVTGDHFRLENFGYIQFANSYYSKSGKPFIAFVGDSWTAGQGADDTTGQEVAGMPTPGHNDGFHNPQPNAKNKFVDKIARLLSVYYPSHFADGYYPEQGANRTYSGTWTYGNAGPSMTDVMDNNERRYAACTVVGDYGIIKTEDNYLKLHVLKLPTGGRASISARLYNTSGLLVNDWKPLSQIEGCIRSDSYDNMDILEEYLATYDYNQYLEIHMPYGKGWEFKFDVITPNEASSGSMVTLGTNRYYNTFINAGRGNHTTPDFCGVQVNAGSGDAVNHLAEVLSYYPNLAIYEPMIINDWFHGVSRVESRNYTEKILEQLKMNGCNVIVLMPGPVVTVNHPWDYEGELPPLADNLHGLGTYQQYYNDILWIAKKYQVQFINTYEYFVADFNSPSHINWTTGATAGRIHVNQHGHDIIYNAFIKESNLAGNLIS